MKHRMIIFFFLAFLSFLSSHLRAWSPEEVEQFEETNKIYREGKFQEAIAGYRGLSEKYPDKAVFFYNLGNSFHRKGDLGSAILAYERAKALDPRESDIRYNLNYAHGLVAYRLEDKRSWYLKAAESLFSLFTAREIYFTAAFFYFLFTAGWAFALWRREESWGWKRKTIFVLMIFSLVLVGVKEVRRHFIRDAVVMAKEAEVRYGPSDSDRVAFRLGEGLKVYVVDKRDDWSRVLLSNGESGWIKTSRIAEVHP